MQRQSMKYVLAALLCLGGLWLGVDVRCWADNAPAVVAGPAAGRRAGRCGNPRPDPQRMQEFIDQKQISGTVTLVAYRGRIIHLEAVGSADLENHRPMRPDTIFCIASMTKPITSTAVMILQDEGKLSIDDPVSKYVPEFARSRCGTESRNRRSRSATA